MSKRIYVGNLGYSVTTAILTDKFGEFGTVESAKSSSIAIQIVQRVLDSLKCLQQTKLQELSVL